MRLSGGRSIVVISLLLFFVILATEIDSLKTMLSFRPQGEIPQTKGVFIGDLSVVPPY